MKNSYEICMTNGSRSFEPWHYKTVRLPWGRGKELGRPIEEAKQTRNWNFCRSHQITSAKQATFGREGKGNSGPVPPNCFIRFVILATSSSTYQRNNAGNNGRSAVVMHDAIHSCLFTDRLRKQSTDH